MKTTITLLLICASTFLLGQAGTSDLSFGTDGYVRQDFDGKEDQARGIVATSDGGVVIGSFSLFTGSFWQYSFAKYLEDGSLDPSFGTNGKYDHGFSGQENEFLSDLIQRPNGKLVACGLTYNNGDFIYRLGVLQLLANGSPDPSFGNNGEVVIMHPDSAGIAMTSMALQPDGKIVLAGQKFDTPSNIMLMRLNQDGSLDQGFGTNGYTEITPTTNGSIASDCAVLPNGKIAVVGEATDIMTEKFSVLAMLLPNGQLDGSFGINGLVVENLGDQEAFYAVEIQGGTHILAAGFREAAGQRDGTVLRYDTGGGIDMTFGSGGIATLDHMGYKDDAFDLALQNDGKILVALEGEDATEEDDFVCVRLLADGQFDPGFGTNGWSADLTPVDEDARKVILDANGKILLAGTHDNDTSLTGLDALVRRIHSGLNIGIEESELGPHVSIYPNPSSGLLWVSAPNGVDIGSAEVLSINGCVLDRIPFGTLTTGYRSVQLPDELANGSYFLRFIGNEKEYTSPFHLQR